MNPEAEITAIHEELDALGLARHGQSALERLQEYLLLDDARTRVLPDVLEQLRPIVDLLERLRCRALLLGSESPKNASPSGSVTLWHPYKDRWYPGTLTCACGAVKPTHEHPAGWWKRYRPKERQTEVLCPGCARKALLA